MKGLVSSHGTICALGNQLGMLLHTARKVPAASGPSNAHSRGMRAAEPQQSCRVTLGGLRLFDIAMPASSGARFAERRLWNVRLDQSALAPENFTTMPHFSISCPTSFPKSADEPGITVLAKSAKRAFILGSARPALISLLSLPTISLGVFFGAAMPYQAVAS